MSELSATPPQESRSLLERVLAIFTEVRSGEGPTALLFASNGFLLLMAYYVIKPVREALILSLASGAELKSYMTGATAVVLLFAVPTYSAIASRVKRNRLIVGVTLFFASNLVLFYGASLIPATRAHIGLVFYLWVGVFNMMIVAQFWAFANDVYSEEQGKRLFPFVGFGASAGAWLGSIVSGALIEPLGVFQLLLVSGAMLTGCAVLTQRIYLRERPGPMTSTSAPPKPDPDLAAPTSSEGNALRKVLDPVRRSFGMVARHRYLTLMAAIVLFVALVNTNGEYILGKLVKQSADEAVAAGEIAASDVGVFIGGFYSSFYAWVGFAAFVLQAVVVSRLVKAGGVRLALFVLPLVALVDSAGVALLPILGFYMITKAIENASDYSINNTGLQMLWLPTTQQMKYEAKQAVDTFFVRMGDMAHSLTVVVAVGLLGFGVQAFAIINLGLVLVWLALVWSVLREAKRFRAKLADGDTTESEPAPAPTGDGEFSGAA
jgi:ATP:ADP antiporter, AAA family